MTAGYETNTYLADCGIFKRSKYLRLARQETPCKGDCEESFSSHGIEYRAGDDEYFISSLRVPKSITTQTMTLLMHWRILGILLRFQCMARIVNYDGAMLMLGSAHLAIDSVHNI